MTNNLRGLIERLEKLGGPDQDVDAEIAIHVLGFIKTNRMAAWPEEQPIWEFTDPARNTTGGWSVMVREYTASLDAAVALVERVLPHACWVVKRGFGHSAMIWFLKQDRDAWPEYHGPTPAIALLIAALRALQENSNG